MNVSVKPNPLGYIINSEDVAKVLNPITTADLHKQVWFLSFFNIEKNQLSIRLIERFAITCEKITNISLGAAHSKIYQKLIYTLASAKKCYSYAENLACIEMCALHCEMLCNYLFITSEMLDVKDSFLKQYGNKSIINKIKSLNSLSQISDKLSQPYRINWLCFAKVISLIDAEKLKFIHNHRACYYHHWNKSLTEVETDALDILKKSSEVSSIHLELLNNKSNLERLKHYIKLHPEENPSYK